MIRFPEVHVNVPAGADQGDVLHTVRDSVTKLHEIYEELALLDHRRASIGKSNLAELVNQLGEPKSALISVAILKFNADTALGQLQGQPAHEQQVEVLRRLSAALEPLAAQIKAAHALPEDLELRL